jgi:hypothetical protein
MAGDEAAESVLINIVQEVIHKALSMKNKQKNHKAWNI